METTISPNQQTAATESQAVQSLDQVIADKMTAMRNQLQDPTQTATGQNPVAPNSSDAVPEVGDTDSNDIDAADYEAEAPEEVSPDSSNSTADELIDFLEFAETNPNAKFKFMRNGKEVVVDAKKAASILGQGSAIHEDARQLKIEKAQFDEYLNEARAKQDGLTLAMEFTIEPKLQGAYDEILKTQTYQSTFQQQLNQTRDPALRAKIQASIQHNENYIRQQQQVIGQLQPAVEQFKQVRAQQVSERLTMARKGFQDKELKNEYVYNEVRDKIAKIWPHARQELIPGVANIDLISSDENLLSLVRDGLRYRDKPTTKSAGASMAQLTGRKGASNTSRSTEGNIEKLREQAKAGDKNAADNLLVAQLQRMRQGRGGR